MPVTIDQDALVETMLSAVDEDYTLSFLYSTMLRSTEMSGRCTINEIASAWIQIKSGVDDPVALEIIDACVACLFYANLHRARERGDERVTEDMIASAVATIRRHWLCATEEDPVSVLDVEMLIDN